jgi:hypothetical protein
LDSAEASLISATNALETSKSADERNRLQGDVLKYQSQVDSYRMQLKLYEYKKKQLEVRSPIDGQLVTWDVKQSLIGRPVQQGNALMTVVDPSGDWEAEIYMPENRMGYIVDAQTNIRPDLPAKYITATNPGTKHDGTVKEVHRTAEVRGEEGNTVLVRVAIDKNDVPDRRNGSTVTARVYCGRAALGYVWLHDLVSWVESKILFRIF